MSETNQELDDLRAERWVRAVDGDGFVVIQTDYHDPEIVCDFGMSDADEVGPIADYIVAMHNATLPPLGSPLDVLRRLRRSELDMEQLIRDVESCNDNNPNFREQKLDTSKDKEFLQQIRGNIARIELHMARQTPGESLPAEVRNLLAEGSDQRAAQ